MSKRLIDVAGKQKFFKGANIILERECKRIMMNGSNSEPFSSTSYPLPTEVGFTIDQFIDTFICYCMMDKKLTNSVIVNRLLTLTVPVGKLQLCLIRKEAAKKRVKAIKKDMKEGIYIQLATS